MSISLLERAATGRSWDPKLACAVTLALVFLCGAAAGALAMNLGVHNRLHQPAFDEQIQSILNDFWQYYRTVLSDSKARVEQLLNEDQRRKFERLLQEHAKYARWGPGMPGPYHPPY